MADEESMIRLQRAPTSLAGFHRPGLALTIEQGRAITKLRIHGADTDTSFRAYTGFAPPPPCRHVEKKGLDFAWLAPGEWLVSGPETTVASWLRRMQDRDDDDVLAVDLSHARVAFLFEGASARTALAGHCPLDLWPGAFPIAAAARSLLGDAGMFIARLADAAGDPRFRIIVDQTMAAYAARLLAGA